MYNYALMLVFSHVLSFIKRHNNLSLEPALSDFTLNNVLTSTVLFCLMEFRLRVAIVLLKKAKAIEVA